MQKRSETAASSSRAAPPAVPAADPKPQAVEINLAQKQKLDCALHLARTVALDFNNALTTILGYTSHLLVLAGNDHPWKEALIEVERAAARAAEVASQLAAFSSDEKDSRQRSAANLNHLVRRTVEMFQNRPGSRLTWVHQLESKLFAARYDEAKIQRAIENILENAFEAVKPDGRIVVQTRNLEIKESRQDRTAHLKPGAYICLETKDDGCGIDTTALPRVFEPYFTTKPGHRGIGLAWVYGVVTNHGGGVAIASEAGQGTSVRVYLPATREVVEDRVVREGALGGGQTILVVDDEEMVLTMAQVVLAAHGYRVLTAANGERALELLSQTSSGIDLLITDMVMPGMNGRELIERVRTLSPTTRILCSTGYPPSQTLGQAANVLLKPFTSHRLLRKVRETLTS